MDGLTTVPPIKASRCASEKLVTSTNLRFPISGTGGMTGGGEASAGLPLVQCRQPPPPDLGPGVQVLLPPPPGHCGPAAAVI